MKVNNNATVSSDIKDVDLDKSYVRVWDRDGEMFGVTLKELLHSYCAYNTTPFIASDMERVDATTVEKEYQSPYVVNGYDNREHYLECMAEDYDVPLHHVKTLADALGPEEDFDGLVSGIDDFSSLQ